MKGGDSNGLLKNPHKTERLHTSPRKRCIGLMWTDIVYLIFQHNTTYFPLNLTIKENDDC